MLKLSLVGIRVTKIVIRLRNNVIIILYNSVNHVDVGIITESITLITIWFIVKFVLSFQ